MQEKEGLGVAVVGGPSQPLAARSRRNVGKAQEKLGPNVTLASLPANGSPIVLGKGTCQGTRA